MHRHGARVKGRRRCRRKREGGEERADEVRKTNAAVAVEVVADRGERRRLVKTGRAFAAPVLIRTPRVSVSALDHHRRPAPAGGRAAPEDDHDQDRGVRGSNVAPPGYACAGGPSALRQADCLFFRAGSVAARQSRRYCSSSPPAFHTRFMREEERVPRSLAGGRPRSMPLACARDIGRASPTQGRIGPQSPGMKLQASGLRPQEGSPVGGRRRARCDPAGMVCYAVRAEGRFRVQDEFITVVFIR